MIKLWFQEPASKHSRMRKMKILRNSNCQTKCSFLIKTALTLRSTSKTKQRTAFALMRLSTRTRRVKAISILLWNSSPMLIRRNSLINLAATPRKMRGLWKVVYQGAVVVLWTSISTMEEAARVDLALIAGDHPRTAGETRAGVGRIAIGAAQTVEPIVERTAGLTVDQTADRGAAQAQGPTPSRPYRWSQ